MNLKAKNNSKQHAMYFGAYLGVYMVLKFILFPLAFIIPFLSFLFVGLTLGVPFIGYYYLKLYRDKACGGYISFGHAFRFSISIYFYASLLAAVAHFVYFQFVDHGFIIEHLQAQVNTILESSIEVPDYEEMKELLQGSVSNFRSLTSRDITFNNLSFNVLFGLLISIPTAMIARRKNPNA